ncbi:MAG: hypothetical protein A2045_04735 [Rhodocyclales bacterium GWA2_65_20]|nr:MAG: hypothetical protein A2045_04735 [Rhodocyclales bacterium GWA2_65_20]
MTESEAVVTAVEGEFALIEVATTASACGSCGAKSHCGTAPPGPRRYAVRNRVGVRAGDAVIVAVPEGAVLKAAMLSYLMPLLFVIGGAAAGTEWGGEGLPAVAGAAMGLMAGLIALRFFNARCARGREPWLTLRLKRRVIPIDKEA